MCGGALNLTLLHQLERLEVSDQLPGSPVLLWTLFGQ